MRAAGTGEAEGRAEELEGRMLEEEDGRMEEDEGRMLLEEGDGWTAGTLLDAACATALEEVIVEDEACVEEEITFAAALEDAGEEDAGADETMGLDEAALDTIKEEGAILLENPSMFSGPHFPKPA